MAAVHPYDAIVRPCGLCGIGYLPPVLLPPPRPLPTFLRAHAKKLDAYFHVVGVLGVWCIVHPNSVADSLLWLVPFVLRHPFVTLLGLFVAPLAFGRSTRKKYLRPLTAWAKKNPRKACLGVFAAAWVWSALDSLLMLALQLLLCQYLYRPGLYFSWALLKSLPPVDRCVQRYNSVVRYVGAWQQRRVEWKLRQQRRNEERVAQEDEEARRIRRMRARRTSI